MKPFLSLLCLLATITPIQTASAALDPSAVEVSGVATEYKEGWKQGWREGYRHVSGAKRTPPVPIPPMPPKFGATWQDGFNDGFVAGRQAAGG